MKLAIACALVLACVPSCALRSSGNKQSPPAAKRYLFPDELPADSEICVPRDPRRVLDAPTSCMPLDELRAWLRRRRVA